MNVFTYLQLAELVINITTVLSKYPYTDRQNINKKGDVMIWTIVVILFVLWLLGFIGHIGGGLIHLLLVIAVIVAIYNLIVSRRSV